MANTKRANTIGDRKAKSLLVQQIDQLTQQLEQRLKQYKQENNGNEYGITILEGDTDKPVTQDRRKADNYNFINPQHYVQGDGRQTWEHMVDDKGRIVTAIFCDTNSYKYNDRIGKKPNEDTKREQDKIDWYDGKFEDLKIEVVDNLEKELKNLSKYLSEELEAEIEVRKKNLWS